MQNRHLGAFSFFLLLILCSGCSQRKAEPQYVIGFSQCTTADAWRESMEQEMQRELFFHGEVELRMRDAERNSARQVAQIDSFIQEGVDLLIVTPNEAEPLTEVVGRAFRSGTPVVVVDRRINSDEYTTFIGSNNYEIGRTAGQFAGEFLKGEGTVIEIWGLSGSTPAMDRHRGFVQSLDQRYPGVRIVDTVYGQWERDTARALFPTALRRHPDVDLVFAHNDVMARGAYLISDQMLGEDKPAIIGVDGMAGALGGLDMVDEGKLAATLLYPTGGREAIQSALSILAGEAVPREQILGTTLIDSSNVRIMKLQADRILTQQEDISKQQRILDEQLRVYRTQRTLIVVITISLIAALLLGGVALFNLRQRQEAYRQLATRNEEIMRQRDQIEAMAVETDQANRDRIEFFTNISHELRTPLTLMLGPISKLLERNNNADDHHLLTMVQRNSKRLLRLINQLMDFRKLENGKMKLQAAPGDLIAFVSPIVEAFHAAAESRRIDLRLETESAKLSLCFDSEKLDKVLFNLLSNAMKFTPDNGRITVRIARLTVDGQARIEVEDNGRGMSAEHAAHAFERFYQGKQYASRGTGLGLSLSKQLIQLHHGEIFVRSELGRGTIFTVLLPLGDRHLSEAEQSSLTPLVELPSREYLPELNTLDQTTKHELAAANSAKTGQPTVLVIEDNQELLDFLVRELSPQYRVKAATDGLQGREIAFAELPDLILSDIMMPGLTGTELTQELKNDLRTSHIPVILLSARSEVEHLLEGDAVGADAYLAKPFEPRVLLGRIASILSNRNRLRERYVNRLDDLPVEKGQKDEQRAFLSRFSALVEAHIGDNDYRVEDLSHDLGLSRVQLYRKIKGQLGMSVGEYIQQVRLKRAKHLLCDGQKQISEIAYDLGFSSPAYFSTAFKNAFGLTPSAYRRKKSAEKPSLS